MRKISAMYQFSGGADPVHQCVECCNCKRFQRGSRSSDAEMQFARPSRRHLSGRTCRISALPIECQEFTEMRKRKLKEEQERPVQLNLFDMMKEEKDGN